MSTHVSSRVWKTADVKGTDLLVLLYLSDLAGHDGYAWPSMETISHYCRIRVRQAQVIVKRLVEQGHLTVDRSGNGRGRTTRYRVMYFDPQDDSERVHPSTPFKPERVHPDTPFDNPERVHSSAERVHSSALKGALQYTQNHHEPLQEPSVVVNEPQKASVRASRLDDQFVPTDPTLKWAFGEGFTPEQVDAELAKFIDYHIAKGSKMVDWQRAFKNWMRNSLTFSRRSPTPNGSSPDHPEYYDRKGNFTTAGSLARARGEI